MRTPRTIVFHTALDRQLDVWAEGLQLTTEALRAETLEALSTRLCESTLLELLRPHPPIFRLKFHRSGIVFTIEPHAIVVRGYDPLEGIPVEEDEPHFYIDHAWHE